MAKFNKLSKKRLATCHNDLQKIFNYVIIFFDCSILCGHRTKEEQNRAYKNRKSQLKYPDSKHNSIPSQAVDVMPYPIVWDDIPRIRFFAGFVQGVAAMLLNRGEINHKLRWGGDWDMDTDLKDNNFQDLVHFELYEKNK